MICKIFYRKVTGDVEKMRISKKEEKKCKIVETEKTKEISGGKEMAEGKIRIKNSRSECNNCIECDPWKNGKSIKKDEKKDRGDPG